MRTLNLKQAADYLVCDVRTLKKAVDNGKVVFKDMAKPGSKLRKLCFTEADLDKARDTF